MQAKPILLDSIADLISVHPQELRSAGLIPTGPLQRLTDERALVSCEIQAARGQLDIPAGIR
jgi:hypothetical protein